MKLRLSQDTDFIAPLFYIPFNCGKRQYVALLDDGSQLNLVHEDVLPLISHCDVKGPITSFNGVQGMKSPITKFVTLNISLNCGHEARINAAVTRHLPCAFILGTPFLIANDIRVDHANAQVTSPSGTSQLITQSRETLVQTATADSEQDVDDHFGLSAAMLDADQRARVRSLLFEYRDLWDGKRIGRAKHIKHSILVTTPHPIRDNPRQHTDDQNQEIEGQIKKMLQDNIIRPSNSPHAAEIVMARKKDSNGVFTGWRLCTDYRKLNNYTVKDAYPMPRIPDLLHAVKGSRFFVALDMRAGYWQIPLTTEAIKYTAFRCIFGLFEYLVMPFGLSNAPATFQRLVDFLFGDYRLRGVLAYLDDLLVHGKSFEETMGLLHIVFDRLRAEGLTINLEKSSFFPKSLHYLGQIIEDGNLRPNPARLLEFDRLQTPTTVYDVRRLLGMLGYYSAYIDNFAGLMAPVFELLKNTPNSSRRNKTTKIEWSDELSANVQVALDRLKDTVLRIPVEGDDFTLMTDASDNAVAATLFARIGGTLAPVEFASKKLSHTEKRWPIRDREAWAIVFAIKKFDCYLRGRKVAVITDHHSLKWMLEAKEGRVARWASRLSEYDLTLLHRSGNEIEHVDYFTRFLDFADEDVAPRMVSCATVQISTTFYPALADVVAAQEAASPPAGKGFSKSGGMVTYHGSVWVPPQLRHDVLRAAHSTAPYRHLGTKKTARIVRRVFNWPGLYSDVASYVKACLFCQTVRPGTERLQGLYVAHPVPRPLHTIFLDFWECTFRGEKQLVLTIIDQLTKWAEAVPMKSKAADAVVVALITNWVTRFGVPRVVLTDNEKAFTSTYIRHLHSILGTTALQSAPLHPQSNGVIESFHRTLRKGLALFDVGVGSGVGFAEALQLVLFAYRATVHSSTGESPAFLLYGMDPRPALDNDWRFRADIPMQERIRFLNAMRLEIQWRTYEKVIADNERKNAGRQPTEFTLGDLVMVKASPWDALQYAHHTGDHRHKLLPRWSLPNRMIHVYPGGKTALVRDLLTNRERTVHVSHARFLNAPQAASQRHDWNEVLRYRTDGMFDARNRELALSLFWKEIDNPVPSLGHVASAKRRRIEHVPVSEGEVDGHAA